MDGRDFAGHHEPMLRRFLLLVSAVLLAACATSALPPPSHPSVPRSRPRTPADIGVVKMLARGGTLAAASRGDVLAVHAVATTFVIVYTLRQAGVDRDKPDPISEARIEEEPPERRGRARDYEVFN